MNLLKTFSDIIYRLKNDSKKLLSIKEIGEYKRQLQKLYDDMEILGDKDFLDRMIYSQGISNTAREYNRLNSYYKDYYKKIIKALKECPNCSNATKDLARRAEADWNRTFKDSITYLYQRKQKALYGDDVFAEDVKTYSSNAYQDDYELPRNKKEEINEDYFDEGLKGVTFGGLSGAALAILIRSLGLTFKLPPAAMIGVSTALGAAVGQFVQKHFFIDFTNYTKLKRYVESEPESYEAILSLMAKNAIKFQQKDKNKYDRIIANLKRLRKNPPKMYQDFLSDEEDDMDMDNAFDVAYDTEYTIKRGNNKGYSYSNYRDELYNSKEFDMKDSKGLFNQPKDDIDKLLDDIM